LSEAFPPPENPRALPKADGSIFSQMPKFRLPFFVSLQTLSGETHEEGCFFRYQRHSAYWRHLSNGDLGIVTGVSDALVPLIDSFGRVASTAFAGRLMHWINRFSGSPFAGFLAGRWVAGLHHGGALGPRACHGARGPARGSGHGPSRDLMAFHEVSDGIARVDRRWE